MDLGLSRDLFDSFLKYQALIAKQFQRLQATYGFTIVDADHPIGRSECASCSTKSWNGSRGKKRGNSTLEPFRVPGDWTCGRTEQRAAPGDSFDDDKGPPNSQLVMLWLMPAQKQEYLIGVDLGGTKILAGVFNPQLKCLGCSKMSTKSERGPDPVINRIARCVQDVVDECDLNLKRVKGVGVGAPGAVDPESGRVIFAPTSAGRMSR